MGIGGSKINCIHFNLGGSKAGSHQRHAKEQFPQQNSSTEEPGNNSGPSGRLSQTSLRRVSHSSMKPGKKLSLLNSKELNSSTETSITSFIDPDDLISIHDLYNMLNDGAMKPFIHDPFNLLIVDSRDLKYYAPSHVITAKHHASLLSNSSSMMQFSSYCMIIIYGNELKNDDSTKELIAVRNEIGEYVAGDILVLKEGFESFQTAYPFLCTDRDIDSIADRKLLVSYPSVILEDQLYQGRGDQATNESVISTLRITHIVNISTEHKNAFSGKVKYLKIALEDVSETNLFQHFHTAADFICNAIAKGGRVLVHCNQGISRSSTITLSYLIKHKKWDLQHAFSMLKARRSCSCPNSGFFKQLSDWEVEILGNRITNIDSL